MNKCLITKLSGIVQNDSLVRIGEMRIKVNKVSNPNAANRSIFLSVNKPVTVEVLGDGYFTDNALSVNKGKTSNLSIGSNSIFLSNNDLVLSILDKYSITQLSKQGNVSADTSSGLNKEINIEDLKYSTALTLFNADNTQVNGNIDSLKNLTALTSLSLNNTQVNGNIDSLKNLTALTFLSLNNTQVNGNIDSLKNLTALTSLSLNNTQVNGNIDSLKNLTALTFLSLGNTQVPLTGDIGELSVLSKCTKMSFSYSKLTGDIANLPSVCRFVSFSGDKGSIFTWGTRPSSAKIIAMEGKASITNIDKMLQDQAQCQIGFSSSDQVWYKTINIVGNRTSASDDAVETLQQKGYTISITNA